MKLRKMRFATIGRPGNGYSVASTDAIDSDEHIATIKADRKGEIHRSPDGYLVSVINLRSFDTEKEARFYCEERGLEVIEWKD